MPQSVSAIAENFMKSLQALEKSRDVEPLAALFSDQALFSRFGHPHAGQGTDAAREFWKAYLANFEEIRSEFSAPIVAENVVVLEWRSEGTLPGGEDINYAGVSVLLVDESGRVREFRTYFDSAALERCAA